MAASSPETRATTHTKATVAVSTGNTAAVIGVLVIACNRPTVTRALDLLLKLVINSQCIHLLYVTGPLRINHVCTNYTELYFWL